MTSALEEFAAALGVAARGSSAQAGPVVEVVDVGANPIDGDPPYAPLLAAGLAHVTGFEPQAAAHARLCELAGPHETYLPVAVGDGGRHELRVCASSGFTSLLEPDADQLAWLTDFPRLATVVGREQVATVRLDDALGEARLDLLKIDVQGGELGVFEGADRLLRDAVAVHTEVGFHLLYAGAPTFGQVDAHLRGLGLVPHAMVAHKTWPVAPVQWADPLQAHSRHLVEADLLYIRDPRAWSTVAEERLVALAVIAFGGYDSRGLALACVQALHDRGAITGGQAAGAEAALRRGLAASA